jgi:hypothetical protein
VGTSRIVKHSRRQHEAQAALVRELDSARVQGQHWRAEARSFVDGLSATIQTQSNAGT